MIERLSNLEGKVSELTNEIKDLKKSNEALLQEIKTVKDHEADDAFITVSIF